MSSCALFGVVSACLPDLAPLPERVVTADAAAELSGCGDGIIATNDDGGDAGESCDPGGSTVLGCSQTCTISCGGLIGPSGHCYFVADPSDYEHALTNCNAAGGHVVTIGSEAEAVVVRTLVGSAPYRIGLLLDDNLSLVAYKTPPLVEEPGWPHSGDGCPGCFALGADDGGTFAPLDPDSGSNHHCLAATNDGRWLQVPCNDADGGIVTVCEREPVGRRSQACGGPLCTTLSSTAGRKRYVISISPTTADDADGFCRGYEGGSLVVFESREEREELARELRALVPASQQHPVLTAWIGLAKPTDADPWRWDDGLDPADAGTRPPPWANGQPAPGAKGRAYMRLDVNAFDAQLAVVGGGVGGGGGGGGPGGDPERRLFICQRK